jgi:hypothetical protein
MVGAGNRGFRSLNILSTAPSLSTVVEEDPDYADS